MTVRVLGEVSVGGVVLTRRLERDLVALLVCARGPVSADRILELLWQGSASRASLQVLVSRVRARLAGTGEGASVELTPAGYRLAADDVDAWVFESTAETALAVSDPASRLVACTRADERWTGTPYAGADAPWLAADAARLAELHLAVREGRVEALLALGHAAAAVRLLVPVVEEHPYREPVWALLARAQYACARQADALQTLATLRRRLADDLGVDPSVPVRDLERSILTQQVPTGGTPHVRRRSATPRRRCRASSLTPALRPPA